MNLRCSLLFVAALAVLGGPVQAQESSNAPGEEMAAAGIDRVSLFETIDEPPAGSSQSDVRKSQKSVQELRQERALFRANQRTARIEYNLWIGHDPLRPRWNTIPMMTSRYAPRKIYIPVYVHGR